MDNVITIQERYIETRRAIDANENLFGLSQNMAEFEARTTLVHDLIPFVKTGDQLNQLVMDAIDMFELQAHAAQKD